MQDKILKFLSLLLFFSCFNLLCANAQDSIESGLASDIESVLMHNNQEKTRIEEITYSAKKESKKKKKESAAKSKIKSILAKNQNSLEEDKKLSEERLNIERQKTQDQLSEGKITEEQANKMLYDIDLTQKEIENAYKKANLLQESFDDKFFDIIFDENSSLSFSNKVDIRAQRPNSNFNLKILQEEKKAYSAYSSGQLEVAANLYKNILMQDPTNIYAKFSLATIYQKLHQYHEAKIIYRSLLKQDNVENREEVVANLLTIISEESPREAVYFLEKLTLQNPDSDYLFAQSALVYEKMNNYEQAAKNLEKAINQAPNRVDYKYNLAIIYDKNKQYAKAIESYYDVLKNYKNDKKWQNIIALDEVKSRIQTLQEFL
jgi:tetratricopeptide (TPR) repeat protein